MRKEEVIHIIKELLTEAGLQEDFSISENTNELADIMIYKGADGIEQLAIEERPVFPFEMIENILFLRGEENDYHYSFKGTELKIIIELKEGARYVVEFGDQGINEMLQTKDYTDIYDYKLIQNTINDNNRKFKIREQVKSLFYLIADMIERGENEPEEAAVSEVKKAVCFYIDEHPQDADFIFSYAAVALQLRVYEDNDVFNVEEIMEKVVERREEADFLIYLEEEFLHVGGSYYLSLAAEALSIIRKIKGVSTPDM